VDARGAATAVFQSTPRLGQTLYLRIKAAALPRGVRLLVKTADGRLVGTLSPYGRPPDAKGVFFTLPVKNEHLEGRTIRLVITVQEVSSSTSRPAKPTEVLSIETAVEP
jgi:hypothetical protein